MIKRLLLLLSAATAGAGCAQNTARPDSGLATGKAPALEYRSAFEGYQAFTDDKLVPWRDANEAVKDGAEHRGHR
jgi:hypothetical protein